MRNYSTYKIVWDRRGSKGNAPVEIEIHLLYILIEKGTTFQLKSIPLIEVKPVALRTQKQRKTDDKHGYQTRDYQTIFSGVR